MFGLVGHSIASWNNEVFCKTAVAVYANAFCVFTVFFVAFQTVTAFSAGDVAFAGNNVANFEALYARTNFYDFTNIFMTSGLTHSDGVLSPFIPLINIYVCTADMQFYEF